MSETLQIYIRAENADEAEKELCRVFGFDFYNPESRADGEEAKPIVRPSDVFICEVPYSDSMLRKAQEALAYEDIFNFTRGEHDHPMCKL